MSGSVHTSEANAGSSATAPPAGANRPVGDRAPHLDHQRFIDAVNAYGLNPEPVTTHTPQRTPLRISGLVTLALVLAWLAWLSYFVVVVAVRVHVWPL